MFSFGSPPSPNLPIIFPFGFIKICNGIYYYGHKYFRYFCIKPSINFPDQWAILFAFTDEQNKQEHPEYEEIVRKLGRRI